MALFAKDLILLHPPAVYDFRENPMFFGPISDVIPSTPVFEMYPIGLTTIAHHLESEGFNVEIVNVAYRMLRDSDYRVEDEIAAMRPALFGIDLHWLPHAQGAIELARIAKKYHPDVPIIFGGLSATYYHQELIRYPCVDMVMRGDSTERPMLALMRALRFGGALTDVPNLTWKDPRGNVVVNELSHVPETIDDISIPNYLYVMRSVLKYGSLANVIPYLDWLSYPITALLTSRGCTQNCVICGGSLHAYRQVCNREKPAFRSPEALVRDLRRIQEFSHAPIFLVHDIRQGGRRYCETFLELLKRARIRNELIFELFFPADDGFFSRLDAAVSSYSVEMTLESQVEELRRINGKFACSNEEIETTIAAALAHGVNRIDLFFMVGIPRQTYVQALESVDYCRSLLDRFDRDRRLAFFTAPLAPFLDPGSLAFEFPERYGYRKLLHSLEDHRQALTAPSWKYLLNYETETMSRDDIVDATYETALRLARLKRDYGYIDDGTCAEISAKIEASRLAIAEIDRIVQLPQAAEREQCLSVLRSRLQDISASSVNPKRALQWPVPKRGLPGIIRLIPLLLRLVGTELYLLLFKRLRLILVPGRWRNRGTRGRRRPADAEDRRCR